MGLRYAVAIGVDVDARAQKVAVGGDAAQQADRIVAAGVLDRAGVVARGTVPVS